VLALEVCAGAATPGRRAPQPAETMTALHAARLAAALLAASPAVAEPPAASAPAAAPSSAPAAPAAAPAGASEPAGVRFGVGAGIGTGSSAPVLYLPFDGRRVRFELDGAYRKAGTSDASSTASRVGAGLFGLWSVQPSVRGSAGLRVQYLRDALSVGDASAAVEAVRFAGAVGAEWAPVPTFSIGVEGQVGYSAGLGDAVSALDVSAQAIVRVFLTTGKTSAAAAQQPAGARRPARCTSNSDCEGLDFCYEGTCRH
jgi:hypothetical protein